MILKKAFFSIGVTTFIREKLLQETLNSIIKQTFPDFEVLVSNDNTERKISEDFLRIKDPRIKIINQTKNLGERNNMNFMLKISSGKYFTWLADDDLYHPMFLETVYRSIQKYNSPSCIYIPFKNDKYIGKISKKNMIKSYLLTGREYLRKYLSREVKVQGCYGVYKKEYISKLGGMIKLGKGISSDYKELPENVYYPYADNWLNIQAGLKEKVVLIDSPLIFYRVHKGSISVTSTDLNGYFSTQKAFMEKSIDILKNKKIIKDFDNNLYYILWWCFRDFMAVVRRSGGISFSLLFKYSLFLFKYLLLFENLAIFLKIGKGILTITAITFWNIVKNKITSCKKI